MSLPTPIVDHVAAAQARVVSQLQDRPNFAAALAVLTGRVQEVEDVLATLHADLVGIDDAVGVQLDRIGALVGQPRPTVTYWETDEFYAAVIKARIKACASRGTIPELLEIVEDMLAAVASVGIYPYGARERFPGVVEVSVGIITVPWEPIYDEWARLTYSLLRQAVVPGVRLRFRWYASIGGADFGDVDPGGAEGDLYSDIPPAPTDTRTFGGVLG